ncbi:MAG: translocation/assembly module TamB domain-containing protein [Spirochaetaceae bacterium]
MNVKDQNLFTNILQGILIISFVGLTFVLFGPVQRRVAERMESLHAETVALIEARLGRSFSYDRISPSIFTRFTIRGVTIGSVEQRDPLLELDSLQVRYRVLPLITGNLQRAIRDIRLQNTALSIDTVDDRELVELLLGAVGTDPAIETDQEGLLTAIPEGITVSGRNLTVSVRDAVGTIRASRLSFNARQGEGGLAVDANLNLAGETALWPELGRIDARVRVETQFDETIENVSALLDVASFESDLFSVNRQQFRLQAGNGELEVRKVEDAAPIDLSLQWTGDTLDVLVDAEEYRLSDFIRLEGGWADADPWLASTMTGSARFRWDREAGTEYLADFSARVPENQIQGGIEFDIRARGDRSLARVPLLQVGTPYGRIMFTGSIPLQTLRPTGSLQLDRIALPGAPALSASLTVSEDDGASVFEASRVEYEGLLITDFVGRVNRTGSLVQLDVSTQLPGPGTVRAWGRVDLNSPLDARLSAVVSDVSVRSAAVPLVDALLDIPEQVSPAAVPEGLSLSGFVDWQGLVPETRRARAEVRVEGDGTQELSSQITLAAEGNEIDGNVALSIPDLQFSGEYRYRPTHSASLEVDSRLMVQGVEYDITAMLSEQYLYVSGGAGIQAEVLFPPGQALSASVRLRNVPVPRSAYTNERSRISADVEGEYANSEDWSADVRELRVHEIVLPFLESVNVSARGRADEAGAVVEQLSFEDEIGTLEAAAILQWERDREFSVDLVADNPRDRGERYELQLSVSDAVQGSLQLRDADLSRARVDALSGSADADIQIDGTLEAPEFSGDVTTNNAVLDGEELEAGAAFSLNRDQIRITEFNGSYIGARFENGTAVLSSADETVLANLDTEVPLGGELYDVRVEVDGQVYTDVDGAAAAETPVLDRNVELFVRIRGLPVFADLPDVWEFNLGRRDGRVSIIGGPEESIAVVIEDGGEFFMTFSDPLPLNLDADGMFSAGEVELNLTGLRLDVATIPDVFDFGDVAITAGRASGSLRMTGPLTDPDFFGTVPIEDFGMTVSQLPDEIGPADGFLVFSEKEMRIHPLETRIGQARAEASGVFLISRWNIEQYELLVETNDEPGVRFAEDFGGFIVDGYGRGTLSLIQDGADLLLSGDLTAHNTTMTVGSEGETRDDLQAAANNPLLVDLTITSGRSVEFLWPTTQLPILRAVTAPGAMVRIQADTVRNTFQLVGDVETQGGELFYLDRTFLIREGLIRFNETQETVDPRVTLRAETRDIGPDGPVRISIIAEESPLSDLTVRAVSEPPLSDEELLAIFGGGVFATGDSLVSLSGAVLAGSDIVSQFGVIRSVEAGVRNALQLDLFSVRTQLFQNLVRGVIDEPAIDSEEAAIPSLGRVFNNTTVFLGRSLGPDVFAELLVQFRASDPFEDVSERAFAGIEVDSEFSLEFETPFFDLQWSFFPRTPDALFVPDNQFTFSWGFTY